MRLRRLVPPLALLLLVLLLVLARTVGRSQVEDLGMWDEFIYISQGMGIHRGIIPHAWGPLYSSWYALLGCFTSSALLQYRACLPILLGFNLLAWWLVARTARMKTWLLVLGMIWLSVARALDPGWPYVPVFTSALVMVAMGLAIRAKRLSSGLVAATALVGLLPFARPEMLVAFVVLFFSTLLALGVEALPIRKALPRAALAVLPFFLMCWIFRSPIDKPRSFLAFGQHFALNLKESFGGDFDPFPDWEMVLKPIFGNAKSPRQAALNNPRAFAWHVKENLKATASTGVPALAPRLSRSPISPPNARERYQGILITLGIIAGVVLALRRIRSAQDPEVRQRFIAAAVVAGAITVAFLSGIVLVRPRPHHLAPVVAAIAVLAAMGWSQRLTWKPPTWVPVLASAAFLLLLPSRSGAGHWFHPPAHSGQAWPATPDANVVQVLNQLKPPGERETTVLSTPCGIALYAKWKARQLLAQDFQTFEACLAARPDVIVVDDAMRVRFRRRDRDLFQHFEEAPSAFGFTPLETPLNPIRILLRSELPWSGLVGGEQGKTLALSLQ
ncbi:hypothetical protein [Holophaga foetida]|uniref:hypothetical protein n=1 Tax=Holophaga foetida TaxID=35839 RepID=UPI0002473B1A|nr:hypothetical protein [Holophaga foetida]